MSDNERPSITGINLEGQYVMLREDAMSAGYRDPTWRVFHAQGGFGCHPQAMGTAVFGTIVRDGEECRFERFHVEGLATDDEIAAARRERDTDHE